ncbi:MAG TPA: dihydropteroate synthase [Steroidobacteraceae bacterium]|nr:dihydropteroate synthase [Steroidobacteraceae bacterium]
MLLRCADKVLDLTRPTIMGVLNVTPDSFSDGGRFDDPERALDQALRMVAEGAAIIDVGGESTRPGASAVSPEEELRRVVPVVERLRARTAAVISVDTSKPEVIRAAASAGAGLINDVRALRAPGALESCVASGCAACLVHMQGEPATMQQRPTYSDLVGEIQTFLMQRVQACRAAGMAAERLVIDPGFGFGKTLEHNLELLRRLPELTGSAVPVLVGVSRKATVASLTGRPVSERLYGSLALAALAAYNGALIIRAHDVAATLDAVKVAQAVRAGRASGEASA